MSDPNSNLPPGVTDSDTDGAASRDDSGLTRREQIEDEKMEHKADMEREGIAMGNVADRAERCMGALRANERELQSNKCVRGDYLFWDNGTAIIREHIEAAIEDAEYMGNLLAIVHCDGGHYRAEHGTRKATDDAIEIVGELKRKLDEAQTQNTKLQHAIDAVSDIGVYPAAILNGPNAYGKRSERQDGWNEAVTEVVKRLGGCETSDDKLSDYVDKQLGHLNRSAHSIYEIVDVAAIRLKELEQFKRAAPTLATEESVKRAMEKQG